MANPEHLAKLKQGVGVWNAWREAYPDVTPDLRNGQLRDVSLAGVNLSRADLFCFDARGVDLHGASFGYAGLAVAWLCDADLREADLSHAHLRYANIYSANLSHANLTRADLRFAILNKADLSHADMQEADLQSAQLFQAKLLSADLRSASFGVAWLDEADLRGAKLEGTSFDSASLSRANLSGSDLRGVDLSADLIHTDLSNANLSGAKLTGLLLGTDLRNADLTGCRVHGVSVWDVQLEGAEQKDLVITREEEPAITVDSLEVAQFIYLLLKNEKVKAVLDTVTSKVVLILGRFSRERKPVLDALREELRRHDYVPVIFDFDKPVDKSIAGTVTTLAKLARFVIADVTDPSWVTVETQLIVRESRSVPFRLIKHESASVPSPINDLRADSPQLIEPFDYESLEHAVASVRLIVEPAEKRAEEIRLKRKAIEEDPW